jgi:hypothetical protein
MKTSALLSCAAVLIAGTAMAASHPAFLVHKPAHIFVTAPPPGSKTLHDQNRDGAGEAILSDSSDDAQAADDFVVPKGRTWMIKEVDVTGVYFNGVGPADSENVIFYQDADGLPGAQVGPSNDGIVGLDSAGSFSIKLANTVKLKKGHYWVSVVANCSFSGCGEWGWELSTDTSGNPAAYRDSGSCATWCSLPSDLMFALKGKNKG